MLKKLSPIIKIISVLSIILFCLSLLINDENLTSVRDLFILTFLTLVWIIVLTNMLYLSNPQFWEKVHYKSKSKDKKTDIYFYKIIPDIMYFKDIWKSKVYRKQIEEK